MTGKAEIGRLGKPKKFENITYCSICTQLIIVMRSFQEYLVVKEAEGERQRYITYAAIYSTILKRIFCFLSLSHYKLYQEGLPLNCLPEVDTNKTTHFFPNPHRTKTLQR